MDGELFARCAQPRKPDCQDAQLVIRPTHQDGRLLNHCRHCGGRLIELSCDELRELREARNKLEGS